MEVCVDSLESVVNAYEGNADRIELCSSLNEGGLTPSLGLLKATQKYVQSCDSSQRKPMVINCMIRSRVGDFCYSETEIETMKEDLKAFIEMDVDGLVFGALTPEGLVNESLMKEFLDLIPIKMKTTFHRAFDVISDWRACFKQIQSLGINKILTSGQAKTAFEGRYLIKELVSLSNDSVGIIAGAGVNKTNLQSILEETGCHEFHASCRSSEFSKMIFKNEAISMGSPLINEFEIKITDKTMCQQLANIYREFKTTN